MAEWEDELEEILAEFHSEGADCGGTADSNCHRVAVFQQAELAATKERIDLLEEHAGCRAKPIVTAASRWLGMRTSPFADLPKIVATARTLRDEFPNFGEAVDALEASFALASGDPEYSITPILVHGEPGIGKTTFAMAIADALSVPFDMVSAGSLQGGFDLTGSSQHWSTSSPGRIIRLLAEGESASPVFLMDEVDKLNGDPRFSPLPVLLDLMESRTAKRFRDEAIQMSFDASRMVVVLTANDIRDVPATLLSRVQVVEVEPPNSVQRLAILSTLLARYAAALNISVDDENLPSLIANADLRKIQQIVRKAAGLARARGDRDVFFQVISNEISGGRKARKLGFV